MQEWRFVPNLENYFIVSENGDVFSVRTEKVLKLNINPSGYKTFSTRIKDIGNKTYFSHRLVAEAFVENTFSKPFVNHKDCNKLNNHYSNLEWCTNKENMIHARDNGLLSIRKAEDSPTAKLNKEDVLFIRDNYEPRHKEYGLRKLAKKFKVTHRTILRIIQRETWDSVK